MAQKERTNHFCHSHIAAVVIREVIAKREIRNSQHARQPLFSVQIWWSKRYRSEDYRNSFMYSTKFVSHFGTPSGLREMGFVCFRKFSIALISGRRRLSDFVPPKPGTTTKSLIDLNSPICFRCSTIASANSYQNQSYLYSYDWRNKINLKFHPRLNKIAFEQFFLFFPQQKKSRKQLFKTWRHNRRKKFSSRKGSKHLHGWLQAGFETVPWWLSWHLTLDRAE